MVKEYFQKLWHHIKVLSGDKAYVISFFGGIAVFFGATALNIVVSVRHDLVDYPPVGDLILDNLPVYNLDFFFTWVFTSVMFLVAFYAIFLKPEKLPFLMKTFGLLILVRLCFIVLTQMGPPAGFFYDTGLYTYDGNPFREVVYRNDLFFSGHTAFPFMAFLIFRKGYFRYFLLVFSLFMGVVVLLMHLHYSIDVFAAFFITYGVYALSNKIFGNLNMRFQDRLRIYGWDSFRRKMKKRFDRFNF